MSGLPKVSIVAAAYNRSQVLKHAIGSVLGSTLADWELIVVGDGCTDDTELCVASFGDPRIRFVNLPRNSGGQAAPNNHGIELARGRYVAFLNQDDLYFGHHLATCAAELDKGTADLVWAPALAATVVTPEAAVPGARFRFEVLGVPGAGTYCPFAFYIASTWMLRRELVPRVGPWPGEQTVVVTPSQAWLFRASRSGARMTFVPRVGVLLIISGTRRGSYVQRESADHEALVAWMREDPHFMEAMLGNAAVTTERIKMNRIFHVPGKSALRALARPAYALLSAAGIHPLSLDMALRFGGRGALIRRHRRFTHQT